MAYVLTYIQNMKQIMKHPRDPMGVCIHKYEYLSYMFSYLDNQVKEMIVSQISVFFKYTIQIN